MSDKFYDTMEAIHDDIADRFAAAADGVARHVECRIDDMIYVYLFEGGEHIQTQHVEIPEAWGENWPSDDTIRRLVHRRANIGKVRITSLSA